MEKDLENFVIEFFKNLKCNVENKGDFYLISDVPESFEGHLGRKSPYRISFKPGVQGAEYVSRESLIFSSIVRFLKNKGKTTLLRIDFNIDPVKKIKSAISFKNCEISNVVKKDKNHFFSRFTFVVTFRYLNQSESFAKEVYVHNGEVVEGDLSGYNVFEGEKNKASAEHLERDYVAAKEKIREFSNKKALSIKKRLEEGLESEIKKIKDHYSSLLNELGGDINFKLEKIKELETRLASAKEEDAPKILEKLGRLRKNIVKLGDDESKSRILKEQEFSIRGAVHKYSLNIENNLVNTTIIYYPVYCFSMFLKKGSSGRYLEMVYDPLVDEVEEIFCESCNRKISRLNLCSFGHVSCDSCFGHCGECGREYCSKCLKKSCSACAKPLCKKCLSLCIGCSSYVCKHHLRIDSSSGEQRCVGCLRACLRCHNLSNPRYFGVSRDGSKVCSRCLAEERREKIIERVFKS